jgi:hypothetical protein
MKKNKILLIIAGSFCLGLILGIVGFAMYSGQSGLLFGPHVSKGSGGPAGGGGGGLDPACVADCNAQKDACMNNANDNKNNCLNDAQAIRDECDAELDIQLNADLSNCYEQEGTCPREPGESDEDRYIRCFYEVGCGETCSECRLDAFRRHEDDTQQCSYPYYYAAEACRNNYNNDVNTCNNNYAGCLAGCMQDLSVHVM